MSSTVTNILLVLWNIFIKYLFKYTAKIPLWYHCVSLNSHVTKDLEMFLCGIRTYIIKHCLIYNWTSFSNYIYREITSVLFFFSNCKIWKFWRYKMGYQNALEYHINWESILLHCWNVTIYQWKVHNGKIQIMCFFSVDPHSQFLDVGKNIHHT